MFNHDAEMVASVIVFSGHVQRGGIPGVEPELSGGITDLICPGGGDGGRLGIPQEKLENIAG